MPISLFILPSNWYHWLIGALWAVLVAYWVVAAVNAKPMVRGQWVWRREIVLRLVLLGAVLIALRLSADNRLLPNGRVYMVNTSVLLGVIGAVLCTLGVGLAIWARAHLGQNWGMPMSQKENPGTVTTGPYARVRHPIYLGFLLAMLGSAIGQTLIWLLPLIFFGVYFAYSARREEKLMLEQFPEQYRAYMTRTKMLVPFIW